MCACCIDNILLGPFAARQGTLGNMNWFWTVLSLCFVTFLWHYNVFCILVRGQVVLVVRYATQVQVLQWMGLRHDSLRLRRGDLLGGWRQVLQLQTDLFEELLGIFGYWGDQLPNKVKIIDDTWAFVSGWAFVLSTNRWHFERQHSRVVSRWYVWLVWISFRCEVLGWPGSVWIIFAVLLLEFEIFEFLKGQLLRTHISLVPLNIWR